MKYTMSITLLVGVLVSGAQMNAAVCATSKMLKKGNNSVEKTIYLLATDLQPSDTSSEQQKIIVEQARKLDALLITRDDCSNWHMRAFYPQDKKVALDAVQQNNDVRALCEKMVESGLIARAHKSGIKKLVNVDFATGAYDSTNSVVWIGDCVEKIYAQVAPLMAELSKQGRPFTGFKPKLDSLKKMVKDLKKPSAGPRRKNSKQRATGSRIVNDKKLGAMQKSFLEDILYPVINTLEELYALKQICETQAQHIIVCARPEFIVNLGMLLSACGWVGDQEVVQFWQDFERKQGDARNQWPEKNLAAFFNVDEAPSYKVFSTPTFSSMSLPFSSSYDAELPAVQQCASASSSQPNCNQIWVDVCDIVNKYSERKERDIRFQGPRANGLNAHQYEEVNRILSLRAEDVQRTSQELAEKQIKAAELIAHYYCRSGGLQEYEFAIEFFTKALAIALNNDMRVPDTAVPYCSIDTLRFFGESFPFWWMGNPEMQGMSRTPIEIMKEHLPLDDQAFEILIKELYRRFYETLEYGKLDDAKLHKFIHALLEPEDKLPLQELYEEGDEELDWLRQHILPVPQPSSVAWYKKPAIKITLGVTAVVAVAATVAYKTGLSDWLWNKVKQYWA